MPFQKKSVEIRSAMSDLKIKIHLEKFGEKFNRPHKREFLKWTEACIEYVRRKYPSQSQIFNGREMLNLNVRLIDKEEMQRLSAKYRHKTDIATVLSFPCEEGEQLKLPDLGDIVMCGQAIITEAAQHRTDIRSHWAHLFIHSLLHILGFDHGDRMFQAENEVMRVCGLPPPH